MTQTVSIAPTYLGDYCGYLRANVPSMVFADTDGGWIAVPVVPCGGRDFTAVDDATLARIAPCGRGDGCSGG